MPIELPQYFGLHAINGPRAALSKAETVEIAVDQPGEVEQGSAEPINFIHHHTLDALGI